MVRRYRLLIICAIVIAVVLALVVQSCFRRKDSPSYSDFSLDALNGGVVTLSDFKGKMPVLLTFGASWCPTCREEISALKDIYNRFSDRIKMLYIDVQESGKKVAAFVEKNEIPYTVLLDVTGSVAQDYGVRGIPLNIVVDIEGKIVFRGHFLPENLEQYFPPVETARSNEAESN